MSRDPYEVLGVNRNSSDRVIKQAWLRKCKQYHPDANPDNMLVAELRFKEVQSAYEQIRKERASRAAFERREAGMNNARQYTYQKASPSEMNRNQGTWNAGGGQSGTMRTSTGKGDNTAIAVAVCMVIAALFFIVVIGRSVFKSLEKDDPLNGYYDEWEYYEDEYPYEDEEEYPYDEEEYLGEDGDHPVDDAVYQDRQNNNDYDEFVTLKIFFNGGDNVIDDSKVMEELNKYLKEKLNCEIEPIWAKEDFFDTNAVLSLQAQDDVDIYFTSSWSADNYSQFARDGYWFRLDDPEADLLDNYGTNLLADIPDPLWDGAVVQGKDGVGIYGVPCYNDRIKQNCWVVNADRLEELGFTEHDVSLGYYEIGPILKAAKEKYGENFYPLCIDADLLERMVTNSVQIVGDHSNDFMAYYFDPEDCSLPGVYGNNIVNRFDTEEFRRFAATTREYYEAGYIDPIYQDEGLGVEMSTRQMSSGEYVIGTDKCSFGYAKRKTLEYGYEVATVPSGDFYIDTDTAQGAMLAVARQSHNPERAVAFIDRLVYDGYIMDLLAYGVEGVHYNLNSEGEIVFTEKHKEYSPWIDGFGSAESMWETAEQGRLVDDDDVYGNYWLDFEAYCENAKSMPVTGYSLFDFEMYDEALDEIDNIVAKYGRGLCIGAFKDVDGTINMMLDEMKKAGAGDILEKATGQLYEFIDKKDQAVSSVDADH